MNMVTVRDLISVSDVLSFDSLTVSLKSPQVKVVYETTISLLINAQISNYAQFDIDDSSTRKLMYFRVNIYTCIPSCQIFLRICIYF